MTMVLRLRHTMTNKTGYFVVIRIYCHRDVLWLLCPLCRRWHLRRSIQCAIMCVYRPPQILRSLRFCRFFLFAFAILAQQTICLRHDVNCQWYCDELLCRFNRFRYFFHANNAKTNRTHLLKVCFRHFFSLFAVSVSVHVGGRADMTNEIHDVNSFNSSQVTCYVFNQCEGLKTRLAEVIEIDFWARIRPKSDVILISLHSGSHCQFRLATIEGGRWMMHVLCACAFTEFFLAVVMHV